MLVQATPGVSHHQNLPSAGAEGGIIFLSIPSQLLRLIVGGEGTCSQASFHKNERKKEILKQKSFSRGVLATILSFQILAGISL
jgi:hypothetical protein